MKKRIVSLLLTVVMAASLFTGCSKPAEEKPAEDKAPEATEEVKEDAEETPTADADGAADYSDVTLNFWSMWNSTEPQGKVIQEAADAFKEQTGATVNIEWKGRDVKTILATALESGEKIDIFEEDYGRIAKTHAKYCYDLTDMAAAANYDANSFKCFNDKAKEWAGFLCVVTEQPQVGGVFYNKDIFADCGVEVPTTWDEFLAVCKTMVDKGYQPLALDGTYADFTFGYHLERMLGQDVIMDMSKNGGWSANEGVAKAGQQIIDFVNAGYLAEGAPDEYPASQNKIGLTGKVAMVVCANYVAAEINNNTQSEINWGMFNYPSIEGGVATTNSYAGANSLGITSYSENPQAAFDFIMLLTTGEFDQKMADAASQIPADPNNTAPAIMDGTVEALKATTDPLNWNMGLDENADIATNIKDICIGLYEGRYATGEEFAAALDGMY